MAVSKRFVCKVGKRYMSRNGSLTKRLDEEVQFCKTKKEAKVEAEAEGYSDAFFPEVEIVITEKS